MANDINICTFTGRLGKDAEVRYMADGNGVANLSIAVGESWKNQDGEKVENTEWVRCVAYRKLAEICGEWLKKGQQVAVSGKMKTRKWEDKDGNTRYTTEVVIDRMTMLGSAKGSDDGKDDRDPAAERERPAKSGPPAAAKQSPTGGAFDDFEDDIPF